MSDTKTKEAVGSAKTTTNLKSNSELIVPKEYKAREAGESIFSFRNFYIEYARFHRDEMNKLIHFMFIPVIGVTFQGIIFYNKYLAQTEFRWGDDGYSVMLGKFEQPEADEKRFVMWSNQWGWTIFGSIYFLIDPVIGSIVLTLSHITMQIMIALQHLDEKEGLFNGNLFNIIVALHIFSWCTQFVGHGIYEQRAPAILTNLGFLFLAPFFETLEFVSSVSGYRVAEKQELLKIVDADIAHYRLSRGLSVGPNVNTTAFAKKQK